MAIARLDAASSVAATTLSFSVSAGSNRCLIACFTSEESGAPPGVVNSVDYGGQAMVKATDETISASAQGHASIWYLLESGIAAASGSTITPTYSEAVVDEIIHASSYTGVNQTGGATTVPATAGDNNEGGANPITTIDLTEEIGDLIIACGMMGNAGSASWNAAMSEQTDLADTSSTMAVADRLSITNANVDIECTWATYNRQAICSARFAFAPDASLVPASFSQTIARF